jgi:glycosyltransferase involved in cell wall biosynthesis
MKRLLLVVPYPRFFLSHRLPLAEAAKRAGYDVSIATAPLEGSTKIAAAFPWFSVHWSVFRDEPLGELRMFRDLVRIYRRVRPDIVHHVTVKPVLYGTLAARITRVPAVLNAMAGMGDSFGGQRFRDRIWSVLTTWLMRIMTRHRRMRMIVQNETDLELLVSARIVRREQIVLIRGSGVDPVQFAPRHHEPNAIPVVALVARLVVAKGVIEFVDAARVLKRAGVVARFVIAGELLEGVIPDTISRQTVKQWVDEGTVEYLGYFEDPRDVYAMSDVICLPSYREGLPKTLLEASASELPVVTTDVPGCRDAVEDGVNGLLVPPRDSAALATAIRTLLDDPQLRREMGQRGRERVLREFTVDRVVRQTLDVYDELLRTAGK